jgi:hypothetical protein
MKSMYLCISHNSRPMDFPQCSLNFLTRRYASPERLRNPPPLESLRDASDAGYVGNVTVWDMGDDPAAQPRLVSYVRRNYKAQHTILLEDQRLLICGTEHLELCDLDGRELGRMSDPWFAGGHTVCPLASGRVAVTCSAPDAVLIFDLASGRADALRIPSPFYGHNYDLRRDDNLHAHYITNDLQRTHINGAVPFEDGFLVSMLIPGAIGHLKYDGSYSELTRGFVGCHGVRTRPDRDGFYFADSCTGALVDMDGRGRIRRRFSVASRWLHDCEWVSGDLYLFCLSDANVVELWDIASEKLVWTLPMSAYGVNTQFSSVAR